MRLQIDLLNSPERSLELGLEKFCSLPYFEEDLLSHEKHLANIKEHRPVYKKFRQLHRLKDYVRFSQRKLDKAEEQTKEDYAVLDLGQKVMSDFYKEPKIAPQLNRKETANADEKEMEDLVQREIEDFWEEELVPEGFVDGTKREM
jgi:hypothetical protein